MQGSRIQQTISYILVVIENLFTPCLKPDKINAPLSLLFLMSPFISLVLVRPFFSLSCLAPSFMPDGISINTLL